MGGHSGLAANGGQDPATGRHKRTIWKVSPRRHPGAHFATFPEGLAEPCIKAGTSAKGCCALCGAPLQRIVELTGRRCSGGHMRLPKEERTPRSGTQYDRSMTDSIYQTVGWRRTCSCISKETEPCIVLDPFIGSGTTAKTSARLGRRCIGLDLSRIYLLEQAGPRLKKATQMELCF